MFLLAILSVLLGCGDKKNEKEASPKETAQTAINPVPEAKPTEKPAEKPAEEPKPAPKIVRERRPTIDITEISPDSYEGTLLRCFRRNITSGILKVHQERLSDSDSAVARFSGLQELGWKRWPPSAAPEMSKSIANLRPEFRECPFLLESSKLPRDALTPPGKEVVCVRNLDQLKFAMEREERISYILGKAAPCAELGLRDSRPDDARIRLLRERCKIFGLNFLTRKKMGFSEVLLQQKQEEAAAEKKKKQNAP